MTKMDFNQKLQQLRTQKGLTQEQLAEKVCVSRVAVSKWESGRGYPNLDSLKKLSEIFDVSVDELLSSNELINLASRNLLLPEFLLQFYYQRPDHHEQ